MYRRHLGDDLGRAHGMAETPGFSTGLQVSALAPASPVVLGVSLPSLYLECLDTGIIMVPAP